MCWLKYGIVDQLAPVSKYGLNSAMHMYTMHMHVCHVHVYFEHVHMLAVCCALYFHVIKWVLMQGGIHIITSMVSCTCYMPMLLHMHIIGLRASQSNLCYILMQHLDYVVI
jgi:hypothetical protein